VRVRRFALAFALAFAVVLGACASDSTPDATPTAGDGRRDQPTEWFLRSISGDDRTIAVVYTISGVASGCEREGRVVAEETGDKVTVTALKSVTLGRNRACTEELGYVEGSDRLDQPLGDRALVGCRPGSLDASEDRVCRDLARSRNAGIFEFSPAPED